MRAIILASGFGTRLYPLTRNRPKALLPIAGSPIIEYLLNDKALPPRPIITTNDVFAGQFEAWLASSPYDAELLVEPVDSPDEMLGSVGSLLNAIQMLDIDEDLLVLAGDNLLGFPISAFLAKSDGNVAIAIHDMEDTSLVREKYGVVVVEGNRIVEFQEKPNRPKTALVSTACLLYPQDVHRLLPEFLATSSSQGNALGHFNQWLLNERDHEIQGFVFGGYWFDIGDHSAYREANLKICGEGNWIDPSADVDGSTLDECVVLAGAQIENCRLRACIVSDHCCLSGLTVSYHTFATGSEVWAT